jgi:hypothetical protein
MIDCLWCQQRFERWRSDELYCTQACQDAMNYQRKLARMRARRAPKPVVQCAVRGCRGQFVRHSVRQRYCSKPCKRVGATQNARRRRARLRRVLTVTSTKLRRVA